MLESGEVDNLRSDELVETAGGEEKPSAYDLRNVAEVGRRRLLTVLNPLQRLKVDSDFLLHYEIGGRKVQDCLTLLREFVARGVEAGDEQSLAQILEENFGVQGVDEIGKKVPEALFYPSGHPKSEEQADHLDHLLARISKSWADECKGKDSGHFFAAVPSFYPTSSLSPNTALRLPRMLLGQDCKQLGIFEMNKSDLMKHILAYRLLFLNYSTDTLRAIADKKECEGDLKHRQAYCFAQLAAIATIRYFDGVGFEDPKEPPSPSLAFFASLSGEGEDKEAVKNKVREYVDAHLRAFIQDCGEEVLVVQEELFTKDLQALLIEYGMEKEYEKIFAALDVVREVQFMRFMHIDKSLTKSRNTERQTLHDLICNKFFVDDGMGAPSAASFGCGRMILEKALLALGLLSEAVGVDVEYDRQNSEVEEGPGMKRVVVGAEGMEEGDLLNLDMQILGRKKLVTVMDSAHETRHPKAYLRALYEDVLEEGGRMYVTDPIHGKAVDEATREGVNRYDSTLFQESMLSLEDWMDILVYLKLLGAKVYNFSIVPGTYAGYKDTYWRISFSVKKPKKGDEIYSIPNILESEEGNHWSVWHVWPFNLLTDEDRQKLSNDEVFAQFLAESKDVEKNDFRKAFAEYYATKSDEAVEQMDKLFLFDVITQEKMTRAFGENPALIARNDLYAVVGMIHWVLKNQYGIELRLGNKWMIK